jgi:hypothetical protein
MLDETPQTDQIRCLLCELIPVKKKPPYRILA